MSKRKSIIPYFPIPVDNNKPGVGKLQHTICNKDVEYHAFLTLSEGIWHLLSQRTLIHITSFFTLNNLKKRGFFNIRKLYSETPIFMLRMHHECNNTAQHLEKFYRTYLNK